MDFNQHDYAKLYNAFLDVIPDETSVDTLLNAIGAITSNVLIEALGTRQGDTISEKDIENAIQLFSQMLKGMMTDLITKDPEMGIPAPPVIKV